MALTIDNNVYNFKTAGHPWQDIQSVMFGVTGIDKPLHFFKPSYRRHCKVLGEEPRAHTQRNYAYRNSFIEGFTTQINARIEAMINERDQTVEEAGAMVHVSKAQLDVDELLYSIYPHMRPTSEEERKRVAEEARRLHQEMLEKMSPAERRAYHAEEERLRRQAAKDSADYWKNRSKMFDAEGASLGRASADQVDLNRRSSADSAPKRGEI
jgi:hypothetical protein